MARITPVHLLLLLWLAGPGTLARAAADQTPREMTLLVRPQDLGMHCVHAAPSSGIDIGAFTVVLTFPPPAMGANRSDVLPRVQLSVRLEGEEEAREVTVEQSPQWESQVSRYEARSAHDLSSPPFVC